jgi:hypothetical protein
VTVHIQNLEEIMLMFTTRTGKKVYLIRRFTGQDEAAAYAAFIMEMVPYVSVELLPHRAPTEPEQRRDVWYKSKVTGEPHKWETNVSAFAAELVISKLRINLYEAWDTGA